MSDKTYYSLRDRIKYYNDRASVNYSYNDKLTGEQKKLSDFSRGYHKAKADHLNYELVKRGAIYNVSKEYREKQLSKQNKYSEKK